MTTESHTSTYESDLLAWRESLDEKLRADDGWLTLIGLCWLRDGENTVGSAADADVPLPADSSPEQLAVIDLRDGDLCFRVTADTPVYVDGEPVTEALLRPDTHSDGASIISVGTLRFYVIRRGDQYGVRVRDLDHEARRTFTGRQWFDIDRAYRVRATFIPYAEAQIVGVLNSVGIIVPITSPGVVAFTLDDHEYQLSAFEEADDSFWLIFKDATNGTLTYGGGRFLIAPRLEDGGVDLDFNRAYLPPCAFTPFATCPLPPRENSLPVAIPVGERL